MRQQPKDWRKSPPAQWLCAALHQCLGKEDMTHVSAMMSGYESVLSQPEVSPAAPAIFTLRQLGVDATSPERIRRLMEAAITWEEEKRGRAGYVEPPYVLDVSGERLTFHLRPGHEEQARTMAETLLRGVPHKVTSWSVAESKEPFWFYGKDGTKVTVTLPDHVTLPELPKHNLSCRPRSDIRVRLADLEALAQEMDQIDASQPGLSSGSWAKRLREESGEATFELLRPNEDRSGLIETSVIDLGGLRHMIGVPGSGKTTLITLLLVWLHRQGCKTAVMLPSIASCQNMREVLARYGCAAGLLTGQSTATRRRHAENNAGRAAALTRYGFGGTVSGAELFGRNCALPGFSDRGMLEGVFKEGQPPCKAIYQGDDEKKKYLCPLASWCGYQRAARELTEHDIWLGHIKSLDTEVPAHFTTHQMRYFELLAKTFDLVIVDEADGAQKMLDEDSITTLRMTGDRFSLDLKLRELARKFAAGDNYITSDAYYDYQAEADIFSALNREVVRLLWKDYDSTNRTHGDHRKANSFGPLGYFKNSMTTSARILSALCFDDFVRDRTDEEAESENRRFLALRKLWERCMHQALRRPSGITRDIKELGLDAEELARDIGHDVATLTRIPVLLTNLIRMWRQETRVDSKAQVLGEMREAFFEIAPPKRGISSKEAEAYFDFLVAVSAVIANSQILLPMHRNMIHEGLHEDGGEGGARGPSRTLLRYMPEGLSGRLSGIRFDITEEATGPRLHLEHLSFEGAPRLLLYRLHQLYQHDGAYQDHGSCNALLASATSRLAGSPTYHIHVPPSLVLKRTREEQAWQDNIYSLHLIRDPFNPEEYLRFSGSPRRDAALQSMIRHLFEGAVDESEIEQLLRDFDLGRKIAIVVNSYEQVRQVKDYIREIWRDEARYQRVIGVSSATETRNSPDWISSAQVETLGTRADEWDIIVFPMKSLARGVNIVFQDGERERDALIGTVIFLTRPHPAADSLDLAQGLAAQATLKLDQTFDRDVWARGLDSVFKEASRQSRSELRIPLRYPQQMSLLGPLVDPFVKDIMIDVLQTIGRAMRNDCKARVIFIDAAWAPRTAKGLLETPDSSMLVKMHQVLAAETNSDDPVDRAVGELLYRAFERPLHACRNVNFPDMEIA